ncbi:MAG TPA: hypothetical protein VJM12_11570 [Pyrinomonadaceae bacterium]|nr:hypothetical protein [Pyrinomonadaceae bacterium]
MRLVKLASIAIGLLLFAALSDAQTKPTVDVWAPMRFFVGEWEGTGEGKPGVSKTQREYSFVLNNKYIQVRNRSQYDPQPKNPKGENHEDWGMISFDRGRKQFVLRQFHVEGFVNQFIMTSSSSDGKTFTFTSESIENIPAGWRARETYKLVSADEFIEVFELAQPGKDFEVYVTNNYRRKK